MTNEGFTLFHGMESQFGPMEPLPAIKALLELHKGEERPFLRKTVLSMQL